MRRILGVILLLLGVALLGWVGYNLFIARQPETQGLNPAPAILVAGALIYAGYRRVRGKNA